MSRPIKIIYEDNHLLVVEKPCNIPSQADVSGDLDLLSLLKGDLKKRYQKPGNIFLGLVHRLDRPVGGVMVLAKTSKAASRLGEQMQANLFSKVYYGIVYGRPLLSQGRLQDYLLKEPQTNTTKVVTLEQKGAKYAELDYQLLASREGFSLLQLKLKTGRSHQIRVQLANYGHPLYGDQKYAKGLAGPGEQLALWAGALGFRHPVTKEEVRYLSKPPLIYPWDLFGEIAVT